MIRLRTTEEIKAYYQGKRDGLRAYAWWKDGTQYIGTTGKLLRDVLSELTYLENDTCIALSEGKEIWI